jgi:DNA ligase-1
MFKPLLAAPVDEKLLKFPLLASTKIDGIRAIVRDGRLYSRSNKPIANEHVAFKFARPELEHYDGELVFGPVTAKDVCRATTSVVNSLSKLGGLDVTFHVFDHIEDEDAPYQKRHSMLQESNGVLVVEQKTIHNLEELYEFEAKVLAQGYEGLILRCPNAPYKRGRSTTLEGTLLKLKRWVDAEFEVIGLVEQMENANEKKVNELGRSQRSSHKAGLIPKGELGALIVRSLDGSGVEFNIGSGFSHQMRVAVWRNPKHYIGRIAKAKWFPIGVKDKPRQPIFVAWRDESDL